jgi:hypothetical protein
MSRQQIDDIVAYVNALSDETGPRKKRAGTNQFDNRMEMRTKEQSLLTPHFVSDLRDQS